ncbi:leucine--tRNA ligase [Ornithobacterium rhinotracheale]|uniref:leucine--tRNA ligase n=1 Tax=Ornithobacterium rhinotracheale TaxID=28251 RepID=UPI004036C250
MQYQPNQIEPKWQKFWAENRIYKAENHSDKPKFYVLDMFPYPSGAGLHVGHPLGYIASDIYARYKRHKGFNVLHPMGYDSFGLPAEQYAIQTGQHPAITTKENIARYREQLDKIGFSFDWDREIRTSNPDYYRWTQWIFLQLFDSFFCNQDQKAKPISELIAHFERNGNANLNVACDEDTPSFTAQDWQAFSDKEKSEILLKYRLTYLAEAEVNWCPALGTVLANDEVINGLSERGGHPVVRKKMRQWMMRITAYAERLLNGIEYNEQALEWTDALKESQKYWIGKSKGASVRFKVKGQENTEIEVFTTRPDTIFGVSFMVLAPEHDLVQQLTTSAQKEAIDAYIEETAKRSERERMAEVKRVTGVFTGAYAINPISGKEVPIWIADYVLAGYGTGAVMAVPAGDERDYAFAKTFDLPIENIFEGVDISEQAFTDKTAKVPLQNSDFLNGLTVKEAMNKAIEKIESLGVGKAKINYRLRDAVFSRQRYWGEPVPIYFNQGIPQSIGEEHLPLVLPEVSEYLPTETGEPPLGRATQWAWDTEKNQVVENSLIDEKTVFPLELNTMPGWAGSSWYQFRYMDPQNEDALASDEALKYWQNVDLYLGGSEHATGHLLYSRFWTKFLKDRGFVSSEEPFKKLINQGMILGESAFVHRVNNTNQYVSADKLEGYETTPVHADVSFVSGNNVLDTQAFKNWRDDLKDAEFILSDDGKFYVSREVEKMSKSKFNVVNPDDICNEYGADTLRMYEMFLGPIEQSKPWITNGLSGVNGFIKKLWRLFFKNDELQVVNAPASKEELKVLHTLIQKVTDDIENFSFNTSISAFMIAVNDLQKLQCNKAEILSPLVILLSPFAPHIAEELWHVLGNEDSVTRQPYPIFEEKYLKEDNKEYPISFNGKMRFTLSLPLDLSKEEIEKAVMEEPQTAKYLEGKTPKKIIVVPGKIVNIVM